MSGILYIVATPIGNLSDMSARAVKILGEVDMIAAEDTRVSRVLLSHYQIKTPTYSCHKFNEESRGSFFVAAMLEGKNVALITDAGTPCVSDPGHRIVKLAAEAGIEAVPVPGACAVTTALSVSGFDASQYMFLGFLPRGAEGVSLLQNTMETTETAVFYESPKRIQKVLEGVAETLPFVQLCLCNDLTKKFEKVYRGNVYDVLNDLRENPNAGKGEYVCVVNGKTGAQPDFIPERISLEAQLVEIMVKSGCTSKEAVQALKEHDKRFSKKDIYAAALRLKEML